MAENESELKTEPAPEAESAEPGAKGTKDFVHVLRNPLTLPNGKVITELSTDFDRLKAKGIKAVAKEFRATAKEFIVIPWVDERFQLAAVAKLNGLITNDLDELGGHDAIAVMNAATAFFGEAV
jgi:hypothetical protein